MTSKTRVLTVALFIGFLFALGSFSFAADDATNFLRKWQVQLKPGEGTMMADLVTIVPTSHRIIVKTTDAAEKTVVLALSPQCKVMEGKMAIEPSSLERGQTVVLVMDVSSKAVLGVYKYF
ncbi:MAG: hypothetical protein P8020_13325 [Acidobacteriota bacterium]